MNWSAFWSAFANLIVPQGKKKAVHNNKTLIFKTKCINDKMRNFPSIILLNVSHCSC